MIRKLLAGTVGMLLFVTAVYASTDVSSEIQILIDSKPLKMEVAPVLDKGRVMVPFRVIFEALGLQVDWNDALKTATAYNENTNVAIKLGAGYGAINGELKTLEAPGRVIDGRMLVPLRFVSEAFGSKVQWLPLKKTVSITSGLKPYVYTEKLPVVESLERLKLILEYSGRFQQEPVYTMNLMETMPAAKAADGAVGQGALAASETDHSSTNVQIQGVDEADVVKTDGDYIYQLRDKDLQIVRVKNGSMSRTGAVVFDNAFSPQEFYLYSERKRPVLVVIGQLASYGIMPYPADLQSKSILPRPSAGPKTSILFYDLTSPEHPNLVRRFETEGAYLTSRVTGGNLYIVANKPIYRYAGVDESILPEFYDSIAQKKERASYKMIRYFPDSVESNFLITLGFSLDQLQEAPDKGLYLGSGSQVFASASNLYVAAEQYRYRVRPDSLVPIFSQDTNLFKFAMTGHQIRFSAKGMVPGRLINQFAMDEDHGNLRVATTVGSTWGVSSSTNGVYVLNGAMKTIGHLEGLAPTERIYAARFLGDRLYLVTFRQVDPFYVISLARPESPTVLGYLKIPGFSDYLHPYDENTVIGFGKETIGNADGDPVTAGGLKVGLFDVSDVAHPIEKSKMVIGGAGSTSEVLNNHRALLFVKNRQLLAFPVTKYEQVEGQNKMTFQGAYVLKVDPEKGLLLRGTSTHLGADDIDKTGQKWYDMAKHIRRLVQIGDWIYTLSNEGIKSHVLESMMETSFYHYDQIP